LTAGTLPNPVIRGPQFMYHLLAAYLIHFRSGCVIQHVVSVRVWKRTCVRAFVLMCRRTGACERACWRACVCLYAGLVENAGEGWCCIALTAPG
jgi:hypothetical protein